MDAIIVKGVAESPFPNTYSGAILDAVKVINAHIPSLSDEDETEVVRLASNALFNDGDVADLAVRTCSCGVHLDGFYQYVDHLVAMFGGESHIGG